MGSGLFMHFSVELELHDGIGRANSVGNFLQYRQILRPSPATGTEPARGPAGRTAQHVALLASSGRAAADWGVSCGASPVSSGFIVEKPSGLGDWDTL